MKEIKRRVEKLEKRIVEKALGLDRAGEIERNLAEYELLTRQEALLFSPEERAKRAQEANDAVLEWYSTEYLKGVKKP